MVVVVEVDVDVDIVNGRRKIHAEDWMFVTGDRIIECIKSLKIKKHRRLR